MIGFEYPTTICHEHSSYYPLSYVDNFFFGLSPSLSFLFLELGNPGIPIQPYSRLFKRSSFSKPYCYSIDVSNSFKDLLLLQ
jgi:hypothetical protein